MRIDNPDQAADHEGQKSTAKVLSELFRHREAGGLPEQGITKAATVAKAAKPEDVVAARDAASAQAKRALRTQAVPAALSPEEMRDLQAVFDSVSNSEEAVEGRASFKEKRKPRWYPPRREV